MCSKMVDGFPNHRNLWPLEDGENGVLRFSKPFDFRAAPLWTQRNATSSCHFGRLGPFVAKAHSKASTNQRAQIQATLALFASIYIHFIGENGWKLGRREAVGVPGPEIFKSRQSHEVPDVACNLMISSGIIYAKP